MVHFDCSFICTFCTEIDNLLVKVKSSPNYGGTNSHTFLKLKFASHGEF